MSLRHVVNVVSLVQLFVAGAMVIAGCVALGYEDGDAGPIFLSAAITAVVSFLLFRFTTVQEEISKREGFAIVTFGWGAAALFGALPYLLTGTIDGFIPAFFESMSGFTTTGATVLTDIESVSHGVLFWRAFTHWLGGMGIIVLAIAILPYLGVGGMQLFKAEVPGPTPERLRPRITQTAKLLWFVYVGLTGLQVLLYLLGGLNAFDAVTHAFATLATGGFSTKNASLAAFSSPYIQYVTILFMYLAGVNFTLHFRATTGRFQYFKDIEWRFFTLVAIGGGIVLALANLFMGIYSTGFDGLEEAFRTGLFQSVAIVTTTGFVSADYEVWAPAAQGLLFALMFVGGMAGSTGGGMKAVRVLLLLKHTAIEIRKHLHPRAVFLARVGKHVIRENVLSNVLGFVVLYLLLVLAGALVMSFLGLDLLTSIGASVATVGNIGPGLGAVGPTDNYGWMPESALAILSFLMVVGRLEIYTVLLLLHPDVWKRRR